MTFDIAGRPIGSGHPTYVIAELSANHKGDLAIARESIAAIADSGADAVKFQTYRAETITLDSDLEWFRVGGGTLWDGRTLFELYREGEMPWEWHAELFAEAEARGIHAFSSPFDPTAVALLAELGAPAYKIASFEITDTPLIELAASQGRPIIISTGIAREHEIRAALEACHRAGNTQVALLKCTSTYPAPLEELNLATIPDMRERYGVEVGFSDHTTGNIAPVTAVALGASIIERHFVLERSLDSLDSEFSTDASGFAALVAAIRDTERALGKVTYELSPTGEANRRFSRSLFVVQDVRAGDIVDATCVRSIRPAGGLPPGELPSRMGRRFGRDVAAGTPLTDDLLAP